MNFTRYTVRHSFPFTHSSLAGWGNKHQNSIRTHTYMGRTIEMLSLENYDIITQQLLVADTKLCTHTCTCILLTCTVHTLYKCWS